MKLWLILLAILPAFFSYADTSIDYEKNLIALHEKIEQLSNEVERHKHEHKVEVSLSSQTDTSNLEQAIREVNHDRFVSFNQFSELSKSLMSRVNSTDASVSTILTMLGVVSAVWGIIITILLVVLTYLHFGSLKKAIEESELKLDVWLKTTALDKIKKISGEAEEKLENIRDREALARKKVADILEISEPVLIQNTDSESESSSEHSQQLESAMSSYKSGDFPVAVLKSTIILEKDLDIVTRIEATKIIANSYQALGLNEQAIKFNEDLSGLVSLFSNDKSDAKKAEIQLNIIMNKYPVDSSDNNKDTLGLINKLVSVYKTSSDIDVIHSVAKARMLKAIAHESNGNYSNALSIYNDIVTDYSDNNDLELSDIVEICRKNIEEINQQRT